MPSLTRILHSTDFSESSANAAEYACFLAEKFAAELHVLYVLEDSMAKLPDLTLGFPPPGERGEPITGGPSAELRTKLGLSAGPSQIVLATRMGALAGQIVEYADDNALDLIVIGTHARHGLVHAILGSVAETVVRTARCPVLTVRHEPKVDTIEESK
jgi:nucleotide-binding universal stress UspA family protein